MGLGALGERFRVGLKNGEWTGKSMEMKRIA